MLFDLGRPSGRACDNLERTREPVLIARYTRAEMGRVWSEENQFQKWLDVELAASGNAGRSGRGAARGRRDCGLRQRARVDVARINEIEAKVRHDVIAFTIAVQESVGDPEAARWLHYGLTSNDVVDTAQALLVREASQLIEKEIASSAKFSKSARGNSRTRRKSAARTAFTPSRSLSA